MNIKLDNLKNILKSKLFIQVYFILFILLNIADFIGISGDLDFFKKILSWILIGYLFYSVSPTKIFIGTRDKTYDILLVLSYSLMAIPKALIIYLREYSPQNFPIFHYFLDLIYAIINNNSIGRTLFINYLFFTGILLITILSIKILQKYQKKENSLVGSIKLNEYLTFIKVDYIIFIIFNIFFVVTIFNLFMEWFAIAVDAIILVLGLIYYLYIYIKHHSKINSKYLSNVSNTGSQFFQNVITTFSNKNTILIGIGFILTLHLLVDAGAYLIPYSIGTGSNLYFDSLNLGGTDHTPIFNFKHIENSQIYYDLSNLQTIKDPINKYLLLFSIIIIDLSIIFFFFSILILPFYYYYKRINLNNTQSENNNNNNNKKYYNENNKTKYNNSNNYKNKINIKKKNKIIILNKNIIIFFISSLLLFTTLNFTTNTHDLINKNNQNRIINFATYPLGIENINPATSISGVDIYTNPIINQEFNLNSIFLSIIIFLLSIFILNKYYKKLEIYLNKIITILILISFLTYIIIFSISSIELEFKKIKEMDKLGTNNNYNQLSYNYINHIYNNETNFKTKLRQNININNQTIKMSIFSNSSIKDKNNNHKDFILLENYRDQKNKRLNQIITNKKVKIFTKKDSLYKYLNQNPKYNFYFEKRYEFDKIYIYLGKNQFNFSNTINSNLKKITLNNYKKDNSHLTIEYNNNFILELNTIYDLILKNKLNKHYSNKKSNSSIINISEIIRLIFIIIFYSLGIIYYAIFFTKDNILNQDNNSINKNQISKEETKEIENKFKYFK